MGLDSSQFNCAQRKPIQTKKRRQECTSWVGKEKAKPPVWTPESPAWAVSSKYTASKPFSDQLNLISEYSNVWLQCEV